MKGSNKSYYRLCITSCADSTKKNLKYLLKTCKKCWVSSQAKAQSSSGPSKNLKRYKKDIKTSLWANWTELKRILLEKSGWNWYSLPKSRMNLERTSHRLRKASTRFFNCWISQKLGAKCKKRQMSKIITTCFSSFRAQIFLKAKWLEF